MKVEITKGFAKRADKLPKPVKIQLQSLIKTVQVADKIIDIPAVKRLKTNRKDAGKYYRIRLGNYRIGIELLESTVKFVVIGDRKEIYRKFP